MESQKKVKILHVETRIQVVFGLSDGKNILQQVGIVPRTQDEQGRPIDDPLLIHKLDLKAFKRAFQQIMRMKAELAKNANNQANTPPQNNQS